MQDRFHLNDGHDARRAHIFRFNERQWQSIRDLVRQWVLGAYALWDALKPRWLTDSLKALIPDSFMPAESLRQEMSVRLAGGGRASTIWACSGACHWWAVSKTLCRAPTGSCRFRWATEWKTAQRDHLNTVASTERIRDGEDDGAGSSTTKQTFAHFCEGG